MLVSVAALLGIVVLLGVAAIGVLPARPGTTLAYAALVIGVGAVIALAAEPGGMLAGLAVGVAVIGLGIGAVGVRRDATRQRAPERDPADRR